MQLSGTATHSGTILALAVVLAVFVGTAHGASHPPQPSENATPAAVAATGGTKYTGAVTPEPPVKYVWRQEHTTGLTLLAQNKDYGSRDEKRQPVLNWETGEGKSYLIPALEIPAFIVLLNAFDRVAYSDTTKDGKKVYHTTWSSNWEHIEDQNWAFDKDSFDVNQFGHPYEGATMFGLARSAGLNFWFSALYANAGSFGWEMVGETTRPSINDQITTGNAGSFFGEALFRTAGLVLEDGGSKPDIWHSLLAAAISPPTAINRFAFGDRFKTVYPNRNPARLWRLTAGGSIGTQISKVHDDHYEDENFVAGFSIAYGLPGKPGYTYRRPFDYFDFQVSARGRFENFLDSVTVRGLLIGTDYHAGPDYRGIWGLYGSYDYIAPYLYRVSSTALSLGTNGQWWMAPRVALQTSLLTGFGFGAAGTESHTATGGYHYGGVPQGLLTTSLILDDKVMLELAGRAYYVTELGSDRHIGRDLIIRANAGVTVRLAGRHAVALQYAEDFRNTYYHVQGEHHFSEGTVSLMYTFLSDTHFGAVEWR